MDTHGTFKNEEKIVREIKTREEKEQELKQMRLQADVEAADSMVISRAVRRTKQTFGDSKQMKAVKKGLEKVDELLAEVVFAGNDFESAVTAYFDAIKYCREFLRDNTSTKGRDGERRLLVEKSYNRLMREAELLGMVKELYGAGVITAETDHDVSLKELMVRARVYELGGAQEIKHSTPKEAAEEVTDPGLKSILGLLEEPEKKITDKKAAALRGEDLGTLRRAFKELPEGKAASVYVELCGRQALVSIDENQVISIATKEATVVLKDGMFDLMKKLDGRMIEEAEHVPYKDLAEMIRDQKDYSIYMEDEAYVAEKSIGDIQKAGTRLARFLQVKTGKPATFFSNLDASHLRMLAMQLVQGATVADIIQAVEQTEEAKALKHTYINTNEVLELVKKARKNEEAIDETVIIRQRQEETPDGWEDDERKTRDFIADLIFSQDTFEADDSVTQPGERMRRMLLKHKDIIATLVVDNYREDQNSPSILDKVIDKLPVDLGGGDASLKQQLKAQIVSLNKILDQTIDNAADTSRLFSDDDEDADEVKKEARETAEDVKHNREEVLNLLEQALNPKFVLHEVALYKKLEGIEKNMNKMVIKLY